MKKIIIKQNFANKNNCILIILSLCLAFLFSGKKKKVSENIKNRYKKFNKIYSFLSNKVINKVFKDEKDNLQNDGINIKIEKAEIIEV